MVSVLLAVLFGLSSVATGRRSPCDAAKHQGSTRDCLLPYDAVPDEHHKPLIVAADKSGFLYPEDDEEEQGRRKGRRRRRGERRNRTLTVPCGATIVASCPGRRNYLQHFDRSYVYLKCTGGSLHHGNHVVAWGELGCVSKPQPTLDEGGRCRGVGGTNISIAWHVQRGLSFPQVTLCLDKDRDTTTVLHHTVHGRYIDDKTIAPGRPSFKTGYLFQSRVQDLYRLASQKRLVTRLLGRESSRQEYLARGHLAPDSDFVLEAEQDATYYYANAIPQWQSINNGNWKRLENSIRELAQDHVTDLEVWTGTHGTLAVGEGGRGATPLFLDEGASRVPVPAVMWKVIYEPMTYRAVLIAMINDISGRGELSGQVRGHGRGRSKGRRKGRRSKVNREQVGLLSPPCDDVCSLLTWVDWDVQDSRRGRTFCCAMDDYTLSFDNLPDLRHTNLLTN